MDIYCHNSYCPPQAIEYSGTAVKHCKLLINVIAAIQQVTLAQFVVGIKINAKDKATKGIKCETKCLELIEALCELEQLDFIKLLDGMYEDSIMMQNVPQDRGANGCFFEMFAQ